MPTIIVEEIISATIEDAWNRICDVERYPEYMEPVLSVKILEEGKDYNVSEWEVLLKGSVLKWSEKEVRNHDEYKITYSQIDGDLEVFSGFWKLEKIDDYTTKASLETTFEIGIPALRDMLNPVASKALKENATNMLASLNAVEEAL